MAGRIRGITIELSGDTKGLVKSLNSAKTAVKDVQTQLKDVNKVLKLDPKNTELLTQKQGLLKKQVDETKAALETQKQALADMQNAADSDKTVEAQNALQREIAETEAALKNAEDELKQFGSVGAQQVAAVGEEMKELGGKISSVGDEMTKKVTGPLMALGGATVASFKSVDAGLDTIVKKTGASGDALEEMEGIFENIAKTVPDSFENIGAAVGEVSTRFGSTGAELEELSTQFIKFAKLNDQDVSTAIDQTQKALSAFGLSSQDASGFLDTMNVVAQNTGVSVDKLESGLVSNGTAFQELGLNIEQSTILMGQLEKSGANSETVLNGLRKALKNATAEGKPLDQALAELEDTILNGTESMDGLTASYDLFGKSGDQIYGAVKGGTLSFKDLAVASLEAGGSVTDTFERTLDPVDKFKLALQNLQLVGAGVGATLLEVITPAIEKLGEIIQKVDSWWKSLSPNMQQIIITIAGVVAAIGPLLSVGGRIVSLIGSIMTLAPTLAGAIGAISGPVGIVVAAIAEAIAIGVALYKNWDEIKEWATKTWTAIKDFFAKTLENIKLKFSTVWNGIKTTVSNVLTSIRTTISNIWNGIKTTISNVLTSIRGTVSNVWSGIRTTITNVVSGIRTTVTNVFSSIRTTVSNVFSSIRSTASSVWNGIKEAITSPIESAREKLSSVLARIKGLFPLSIGKVFSNIKLPHFNVSAGSAPFGIGGRGTKPSFSVDWYAKAMRGGMILDGATIFGVNYNGQPMGGGEAGAEWIIGQNSILSMINSAVKSALNTEAIYEAAYRGTSNARVEVYIDGRRMTDIVNQHNTSQQLNQLRAKGAF